MMAVSLSRLSLLLAFFIAIDTSEVYPPEVRETFVENALVGQTFTRQLPADTAVVFMTGNFGVCKSKRGIVVPLSEVVNFAKEVVRKSPRARDPSEQLAVIDGIHEIARSFLRMFHGEVGIALLNFPVVQRPPDFILRADIDESEMRFAELAKKIGRSIFGVKGPSFVTEEDGYLILSKKICVQIKDKKLYMANSPLVIEQFLSGAWKGNPLSDSPVYREMGKKVEFDQEQFLFVNVERMWEEFTAERVPEGARLNVLFGSLVSNMRAIANSTRLSQGNLNILSAVLFKDLTKGIPRILARPNARSEAATFAPADYSLLTRVHTGSPVGLLEDIMALDEEVARGLDDAFARIERQVGFSVEKDLLPALSGDLAVAAKVPLMVGLPESLAIIRIADHDKAVSVIGTILGEIRRRHSPAPLEPEKVGFPEQYKGAELRIVPVPLVSLTYVFVEGHLLLGSSSDVVKAAIDARLSGKNLAASKEYKSAFDGHPSESFATIYVDAEAMFNGLLNIGGGLAMWRGGREARQFIVPVISLLRRNVKSLDPISCSIYRQGNAIVVRTNSRLFAAGPAPIFLAPWFLVSRVAVRPEAVMEEEVIIEERMPR